MNTTWKTETAKNTKQLEQILNQYQSKGWSIFSVVCDPLSGAKSHFGNRGKQRYTIIMFLNRA